MRNQIKNQITSEILKKIKKLEKIKKQEKQEILAQEIIQELDIEDFTPYMAYDDEGNIFIALNYIYSGNGVNECLMTGKHDAVLITNADIVYIEDEAYLKEQKEEQKEQKEEQKKHDEISKSLEFYSNALMNLINYEKPKCVGNYEKFTKIEKEIANLEKIIQELEKQLEEIE
jgi:hypothetical protein